MLYTWVGKFESWEASTWQIWVFGWKFWQLKGNLPVFYLKEWKENVEATVSNLTLFLGK